MLSTAGVRVERLGSVNDDLAELFVQLLEEGLREARADVADSLVGVIFSVVACKQEGAVPRCALAFAMIAAQDDEVEGVAYTGEVVFLDLRWEVLSVLETQ